MTTLKVAVVPAKISKKGTHKVRIAVGHLQQTRYIATRFVVETPDNLRDGQVVNVPDAPYINMKLRSILNSYQEALDKINTHAYSCKQIIEYLKTVKQGSTPYMMASDDYTDTLMREGRKSTAKLYERTSKYFIDFCRHDIMLDGITPRTIKDFDIYMMRTLSLNPSTRGTHMAHLKAIINQAIRDCKVKYDTHPFSFYEKPTIPVRELDISVEDVRLIRDSQPKAKALVVARDAFMLSYYLGGINLVDLLNYNFKGKNTIEYERQKSKNTKKNDKKVCFTIPDEAKPIIKRYMARSGKLNFGYKLSYDNLRRYITANIVKLGESLGIEERVVYYSARKSFAQHGFELGISLERIEYCIGQSMKGNRPIFSYVKINKKHADETIRAILDNLKNG